MGQAKRALEDAEARLFWASWGDVLCTAHVSDPYLARLASEQNVETCVVCGRAPINAIDLDVLLDVLMSTVRHNWGRAIDDLFYDRESESGFAFPGEILDTGELVRQEMYGDLDEPLLEEVVGRLLDGEQWYDPALLWLEGAELLSYSWNLFAEWSRSTAEAGTVPPGPDELSMGEQADGIAPREMLPRLTELVEQLGLVRQDDRPWYRARHLGAGELADARSLGTAPKGVATPGNRMSRAGDPMFYGAIDADTTLREVGVAGPGERTVVGRWVPDRPLRVLDLTDLPSLPSFYDVDRAALRQGLLFLGDFAEQISRRIDLGDAEIEYRPTQAVASHFRDLVSSVDGILYASSHTRRPCCVLFIPSESCVDSLDGLQNAPAPRLALQMKERRS